MLKYSKNNYYTNVGDIVALVILGKTRFFCDFCIGTTNNWYFFVSSPPIHFWYGSRVLNVSSNQSWSRSNKIIDIVNFPLKLYVFVFKFSLLLFQYFWRTMNSCAYNPCYIPISQDYFDIMWYELKLIWIIFTEV